MRSAECKYYEDCLTYYAKMNTNFTCEGCPKDSTKKIRKKVKRKRLADLSERRVHVRFKSDECYLKEWLKKAAKKNCRSMSKQTVFFIKQAYENENS